MKNLLALVVTHNRQQSLINCIEAIRSQSIKPDQILVINNGSSDYTSVWLDQQEDIIHIYQENTGSSGGFNKGISWSHQHEYNWVWCMEDDSYPEKNALEMLLNKSNEKEPCLLSSLMINESGDQNEIVNPFNGTLIHHSIISKAGLPKTNLFSTGAEAEYYYRITRKCKFTSIIVSESIHFHSADMINYKLEWNMKSSVNLYFMIRNQFEVYKSKFSNKVLACFKYISFIYKFLLTISSTQKNHKWSKATFVLRAMADGLSGNYHETVPSIQHRINRLYRNSAIENFIFPIRNLIITTFVPSFTEMRKSS